MRVAVLSSVFAAVSAGRGGASEYKQFRENHGPGGSEHAEESENSRRGDGHHRRHDEATLGMLGDVMECAAAENGTAVDAAKTCRELERALSEEPDLADYCDSDVACMLEVLNSTLTPDCTGCRFDKHSEKRCRDDGKRATAGAQHEECVAAGREDCMRGKSKQEQHYIIQYQADCYRGLGDCGRHNATCRDQVETDCGGDTRAKVLVMLAEMREATDQFVSCLLSDETCASKCQEAMDEDHHADCTSLTECAACSERAQEKFEQICSCTDWDSARREVSRLGWSSFIGEVPILVAKDSVTLVATTPGAACDETWLAAFASSIAVTLEAEVTEQSCRAVGAEAEDRQVQLVIDATGGDLEALISGALEAALAYNGRRLGGRKLEVSEASAAQTVVECAPSDTACTGSSDQSAAGSGVDEGSAQASVQASDAAVASAMSALFVSFALLQ